jgi:hypothetical protein
MEILTFRDVPLLPNRSLYFHGLLGDGGPIWPEGAVERHPELRHHRRGRAVDEPVKLAPRELASQMKRAEILQVPCIWGGFAQDHFGHFIADHMTRIVAAQAERPDDSALFTLPPGADPNNRPGWFWSVTGWYGFTRDRVRLVSAPVLATELRVAPQAEQVHGGPPDPSYLALIEALPAARALVPKPVDLLYVTRAGLLTQGKGGHAGEAYLAAVLRGMGVAVLDPGTVPLVEQLALYAGARRIVFAEGSAMHGRQILGRCAQEIVVLNRRPRTRTAEGALSVRCDRLRYVEAAAHVATPARPNGREMPAKAISFYDQAHLFDSFASLGINLRHDWDTAAFTAARDADIRAWLSAIPAQMLGTSVRDAFLAAGLGPLDRW